MEKERLRILGADGDETRLACYRQQVASANRSGTDTGYRFEIDLLETGAAAIEAVEASQREGPPFAAAILDLGISCEIGGLGTVDGVRRADADIQLLLFCSRKEAASAFPPETLARYAGPMERHLYLPELQSPDALVRTAIHLAVKWRAQVRYRGSRALFTAFLRHLPGIAFIKDAGGRYLYLNEIARRLMKKEAKEYLYRKDPEIWPPEMARALMSGDETLLMRARSGDYAPLYEETFPHSCRMIKFPIPRKGGNPFIGGICMKSAARDRRGSGKKEPSAGSEADLPALDTEDGLGRVGNNISVYKDLLRFFCEEKSTSFPRVREQIEAGFLAEAAIGAHALKGSAATIGATALENGARHLEAACSAGDSKKCLLLLDQVQRLFAELKSAVNTYTETPGPPLSPDAECPPDANSPYKILLVDDNKTNIDVLIHALRDHYRLGVARDGKKAIEYARKHQPHLILLDLRMPEMDGETVCRRLKEAPETAEIPVIFLTAAEDPADRSRCRAAGGADYITKPFDVENIRTRVEALLARLVH